MLEKRCYYEGELEAGSLQLNVNKNVVTISRIYEYPTLHGERIYISKLSELKELIGALWEIHGVLLEQGDCNETTN